MELLIGSHVREHGKRVGRLAGFELEPATRRIRRIIFSPNGELGPQAGTRPLSAISPVSSGSGGADIDLRTGADTIAKPRGSAGIDAIDAIDAVGVIDAIDGREATDVVLLSRATRLKQDGREIGRLIGLDVSLTGRQLASVFGRAHWWSKRASFAAADLDCSIPGEISVREPHDSRAA
jgi:hypothetical protein